jgi:hypothetical protein
LIREISVMPMIHKAAVCLSLFCTRSAAFAQQPRELVSCKPMSQKTVENGCWILASHPLGAPESPVYWTIDVFPTKELAEQAKGAHGTVVGTLGKVWLLTIGEKPELRASGTRVTQIGPLAVAKERSYTA